MKVFLTGASGFIASALIPELLEAGHTVLGLTRSQDGAKKLEALGVEPFQGSLENTKSLIQAASQAEGVIHCAYDQDLSDMAATGKKEAQAIAALAAGLAGSDRPLVITSVAAMGAAAPGQLATENFYDPNTYNPRKTTEIAGEAARTLGTNVSTVRLSQIHSSVKLGFISMLMRVAKEKGVSAYLGDGAVRWAAAHVSDTARLYRLALEKHASGARYNVVAEEGVSVREIAEAIGADLKIPVKSLSPEEAQAHFGWFAMFVNMDMSASSQLTRQELRWQPTGPDLVSDIKRALQS